MGEFIASTTSAAPIVKLRSTTTACGFAICALGACSTVGAGATTPVAAADIVYNVDPGVLTSYRYATLACLGANRYWWDWGGSRGHYLATAPLPLRDANGDVRAAIVPDPDDDSKLAFQLSAMPGDPDTSTVGGKRCEMALGWQPHNYPGQAPVRGAALPRNQDFWWTIKFRLGDWRATSDRQVIFQWLTPGADANGPMLAADVWGSNIRLEIHHDFGTSPSPATTTKLIPWSMHGWQPNHWYSVAIHARIDAVTPADGRVAMWLDGTQVLDYHGPIGYTAPAGGDYAKFGLYHWTINNPWDMAVPKRIAWYRGPALIIDRAGYDVSSVRAVLE